MVYVYSVMPDGTLHPGAPMTITDDATDVKDYGRRVLAVPQGSVLGFLVDGDSSVNSDPAMQAEIDRCKGIHDTSDMDGTWIAFRDKWDNINCEFVVQKELGRDWSR